jgi:L-asparaginase
MVVRVTRVLLLATGDTIAYTHRAGRPHVATGSELVATVPPDALAADVTAEDVAAEPSWDMPPGTMLALARRARDAILAEAYDGVVITHGTETLDDTAYLCDLLAGVAAARGAIVLTAATRRLDALSSDGPRNIASSIAAAADPALRDVGAVVCANDELHAARWVTHVDAAAVTAFSSAPHPALGRVTGGQARLDAAAPARPPDARGEPEADVALIKTYVGMGPEAISAVVDAGARGVVLEGTGLGNVPVSLLTTVDELTRWDIPVVVASRAHTGPAPLRGGDPVTGLAAEFGAIGARGLSAAKARVALMVALGGGVTAVRGWFEQL